MYYNAPSKSISFIANDGIKVDIYICWMCPTGGMFGEAKPWVADIHMDEPGCAASQACKQETLDKYREMVCDIAPNFI